MAHLANQNLNDIRHAALAYTFVRKVCAHSRDTSSSAPAAGSASTAAAIADSAIAARGSPSCASCARSARTHSTAAFAAGPTAPDSDQAATSAKATATGDSRSSPSARDANYTSRVVSLPSGLDLRWNCGSLMGWHHLRDACNQVPPDWATAAKECTTANPDGVHAREARNAWRAGCFLSCVV